MRWIAQPGSFWELEWLAPSLATTKLRPGGRAVDLQITPSTKFTAPASSVGR